MKDILKTPFYLGFEIHQQLQGKLFCSCGTLRKERKKLNTFTSTLTKIENQEVITNIFGYVKSINSCDYELDQKEPVLNLKILREALIISERLLLFTDKESLENTLQEGKGITFIRKRILDGSIICGFQRTAIIGSNKEITIRLEEDSCMKKEQNYYLSRQGISLIEVTSKKYQIITQEEFDNFLKMVLQVGTKLRENKVRKGPGSIRQDINISLPGGAKVEIKGVSTLSCIQKIINKEIERQLFLPSAKELISHTRYLENSNTGQTKYLRDYEGDTRYFSEPEISTIFSKTDLLEVRKRNFESKIVSLLLNENLKKEIASFGLCTFTDILLKTKSNSVLELTIGEISGILKGYSRIGIKQLKNLIKDKTFNQARKYLSESSFCFNKYELRSLYQDISYCQFLSISNSFKNKYPILLTQKLISSPDFNFDRIITQYYQLYKSK